MSVFTELFFKRDISRTDFQMDDEYFSYPSNVILRQEVNNKIMDENEDNSLMRKASPPNRTAVRPTNTPNSLTPPIDPRNQLYEESKKDLSSSKLNI